MLIAPGTVQLEGLDQERNRQAGFDNRDFDKFSFKGAAAKSVCVSEIGQGGGFAILGGLLGLSAAVIVLGMISPDHEVDTASNKASPQAPAPRPAPLPPHAAETLSLASLGAENMLAATLLNKSHQIKTPPQSVLEAVS